MATFGDPLIPGRIWSKVELVPFSTCWWWGASLTRDGYGQAYPVGSKRVLAHRYFYETLVASIPAGLQIDHFRCSNRSCCNPEHVRPVTPRENVLRSDVSIPAQHRAKSHCPSGHEYDLYQSNGRGAWVRRCSICRGPQMREAKRRYWERRKEEVA